MSLLILLYVLVIALGGFVGTCFIIGMKERKAEKLACHKRDPYDYYNKKLC